MKEILCLTSHDLNAPAYGSVLRAQRIFQMLSRFGRVRVVLAGHHKKIIENAKSPQAGFELLDKVYFPPTRYPVAERMRNKLNPRFLDIRGRQALPNDRQRLQALIEQHHLIWVHGLEIANGFGLWHWPRSVLDVDDIPSSVHRLGLSQAATLSGKYWECRQMILWQRHEKFLAERFDTICVCSRQDREKLSDNKKFFVLPNGFDVPQKAPPRHPVDPPQIGFVGTFKYPPNRDGIRWFIENVWPRVLEKFPLARLRLAGDGGEDFFSGPNVDVLGWVADMENEMANWSLALVPILVGGGTRIKILEAFSRKCPVVSTLLGAYGHDVENGCDLFISDSPEDFAGNCLRILADPAEGERLAESAWNKFLQNWTWDSQIERVAEIACRILGTPVHFRSRNVAFDVQIHSKSGPQPTPAGPNPIVPKSPVKASPGVSVIIPTFNRAHCVSVAIESVIAQTFSNFEIIIVDDGSSDGTNDVLEKFGDRIRVIHQKNRGVSAARNNGIRAARGKWIAFLDSDDRWHPEKLQQQLAALEKYSAKICFTRSLNTENEPLRDIEFISATSCGPEIFHVQNAADSVCVSPRHPMIQTMMVEKKLLERAGLFDESFFAAEDAELIFRLSFLSGFIYIDRPLATVRENSINSLTYSEELETMAQRNQSYLRLLAHMYWRVAEQSPEKISIMRKRLGYFISRRAEIACAAGELPVARTLARDGIFFAGSIRDFARCAGILLFPGLIRGRAQRKWPA